MPRVVEKFPGQHGQFGRQNAQFEAQPFVLLLRPLAAHVIEIANFALDQRVEERFTKILHGLLIGGKRGATASARAQQSFFQAAQFFFKLCVCKWKNHGRTAFTGRRI